MLQMAESHSFFYQSVQFSHSVVSDSATPWTAACQAFLSITNSRSLLKLIVHWVHDAIQLFHLLSSPSPPAFNHSQHQGLFQWVSSLHQAARLLELQVQHQSEYSGLFPLGWTGLDLLAVPKDSQESSPVPQFKSIDSSVLSFLYSPTLMSIHDYWKTKALTRRTFVGKVMSLLFNMLSRLVITFLPGSKRFLISWLQSPSAVILETPKIKSVTVSIVSPSICHEVMGPDAMIFVFWMLTFKPTLSLSSFTFIRRLFSSSLLSTVRVMSSGYPKLLIFLLAVLILAYASSSPAFSWCTLHIS